MPVPLDWGRNRVCRRYRETAQVKDVLDRGPAVYVMGVCDISMLKVHAVCNNIDHTKLCIIESMAKGT